VPENPIEPGEAAGSAGTPVTGLTTVRRAPRYRAFFFTGVLLGLTAGGLAAALVGATATGSVIVLSAVVGGLLGGWLGALLAVLLDRAR
jgi:hypothetical protein